MSPESSAAGFVDFWKDFLQQSGQFWSQAAAKPQTPDPAQIWRQFFTMWTEFWSKAFTQPPDTLQASQKLWMEQLETMAQGFASVMGTDTFAAMQNKFFEQNLVWQERLAQTMNPQTDAALQALNLPSRSQIDRLFDRVIGIEERLDDLEANTRQILRKLRGKTSATTEEA
jgi:hypothetical protein